MKGVRGVTCNFMAHLHRDGTKEAEMWDATRREPAANFLMQKTVITITTKNTGTKTLSPTTQTHSQTGGSGPRPKATKGTNTMGE